MARSPQAKEVFLRALKEDLNDRRKYLDIACANDRELRRRVEALLAAHDEPESYLDRPAIDLGSTETEEHFASSPRVSEAFEEPGASIGSYKLLQEIGQGGFGMVYMAEQQEPVCRQVALKIIKPGMDSREVIARFEAERQALALMDHPNIARVLDAGATSSGRPYFVMELVKGVPITEFCDRNRTTTRQRLELFATVCQAVQHAHQKGVIHRDLKPSNVMVTLHDGMPVPKVIDFGISKAISQRLTEKTLFTRYGQMVGTPQYMSPEQAEMSGLDVDTRCDIYSLGVLLYELLTGTTPIEAESLRTAGYAEMLRIIQEQDSPKPSSRLSTLGDRLSIVCQKRSTNERQISRFVRGELDWIVMKALEKDRSRRYDSAGAFRADVNRFLRNEPVTAVAPSNWYLLQKFASKHRSVIGVASGFVVVLVTTAVICSILALQATRAKREVQSALTQAELATESAELARDDEKQQRQIAETERLRVSAQREIARLNLYAADMKAVNNYLVDGSLGAARALLQSQVPKQGEADLRGWEWRYFNEKAKGDHLYKLVGHTSIINRLAFSPNGQLLLSRGYDETILWDWQNKTMLRTWEHVREIGFSSEGLIGLLSNDGKLELLDSEKLEPIGRVQTAVKYFVFSPRDEDVILVTTDGALVRWKLESGDVNELCKLDRPTRVVFSPDGKSFGWLQNNAVKIWNVSNAMIQTSIDLPEELRSTLGPYSRPRALAAMFTGGEGFVVRARGIAPIVYRSKSGGWVRPFPNDAVGSNQMMMSQDGNVLVTGSYNHDVSMWSAPDIQPIARLYGHGDEVFSVAITADGAHLASGSQDKSILIWNARRSVDNTTITKGLGPTKIVYAESGQWMATPTPFFTTTIRDPETLDVVANVKGVAVHELPEQSQLITAKIGWSLKGPSLGHEITYWNTKTWRPTKTTRLPEDPKIGAAANGKIAAIVYESQISLIDLTTEEVLASWNHGLKRQSNVPLLPITVGSGDIVVAAGAAVESSSGVARIWDFSGTLVAEIECDHNRQIVGVACSPDEKRVVTASYDATIKVWDVASASLEFTLRGHRRGIHSVSFSPDGKTLVSHADDRMVKLWHVATGRELATLHPIVDVGHMRFSRDGRSLIGHGASPPPKSSQMQIWRAPP